MRKAESWDNSLLQKKAVCCALWHTHSDIRIRRFQSVWMSIWGQIHIHTDENPIHIMVFGVVTSDSDIMPPFIFPQRLGRGSAFPGSRGWPQATGLCVLLLKQENCVGWLNISATTSALTTGRLTHQIAIPLICGARLIERSTKLRATPKTNWRQEAKKPLEILVRDFEVVWRSGLNPNDDFF